MLKAKLFYRQKILLGLSEVFNEPLPRIDFMKLLFLLCKESKQEFYSFFPFKYGCFSFQVYQDWQYLKSKNLMSESELFRKNESEDSILNELRPADKKALMLFKEKYACLRGDELIHKTYMNYPEYAIRSEIKGRILTTSEQQFVSMSMQVDSPAINHCVFTIGYESISIDEYLRRLICNGIDLICDVRFTPRSMKYDFNDNRLSAFLKKTDIAYFAMSSLGIPGSLRQELHSEESYHSLFDLYEKQILPQRNKEISNIAQIVQSGRKAALTCFEKNPNHCHRSRVAAKLSADFHFPVMNI